MILRQERSRQLHELADTLKLEQLNKSVGETANVLWEKGREETQENGEIFWRHQGYTPNYQRVITTSVSNLANKILPTTLVAVKDGKLLGRSPD